MIGKVILDIETVGVDWEGLPQDTQDYLLKYSETEKDEEKTKDRLAFWAPTAKTIVIGLLNPDTNRAVILAEGPPEKRSQEDRFGDVTFSVFFGDEKTMVTKFWELIAKYNQYITFNGRRFDCPFLMHRSLILGLTPSRNLDTPRYNTVPHLDLMDVLTFFGAARKFTLQFWCQALGIEDPKAKFGDGSQVPKAYQDGRMKDIIEYNLADLVATAQLYRRVQEHLLSIWNKK